MKSTKRTIRGVAVSPAQGEVYDALKEWGPFPDHILVPVVQHTGPIHQHSSGIRTRRRELERKGLVAQLPIANAVTTNSGRKAVVFKAVV